MDARFDRVKGFLQITRSKIVVADHYNHCLRLIDRTDSNYVSEFSGQCGYQGFRDGAKGRFGRPYFVARDVLDQNQLVITDHVNGAVRTVSLDTKVIGTIVNSTTLKYLNYLTQDKATGTLYVVNKNSIHRVSYKDRVIKKSGYLDSTLLLSRFDEVCDLTLIGSDVIIAADSGKDRLRLLNLKTNQTSNLSTCSKDECYHPY